MSGATIAIPGVPAQAGTQSQAAPPLVILGSRLRGSTTKRCAGGMSPGWAALALALLPAPALADGLVDNVAGLTLDADGRLVRFRAIVVDKDGKVVRLIAPGDPDPLAAPPPPRRKGKRDEAPPAPRFEWRADLKGRVVMPGFVDAHGHVGGLGLAAETLDLSAARSLDEAKARIAAYAAANPERKWIVGRGWNQEAWGLGRFPTAADIDSVVADRPVALTRADGHALWANGAAMQAAGITAASRSPGGGRIETSGGKPTGVFVDAAMALFAKAIPQPSPKELAAAFLKAQQLLLADGITAVGDMSVSLDQWLAYRRMGDIGALRIRLMVYGNGIDDTVRIGGSGPTPWLYGDRLRLVGVKLYADGALGSRGAWLVEPYHDAPGQRGLGFWTDDQLQNLMSRAAMDNYQIAVHAIGDRANDQVLNAIDELAQTYKGDRRWRVEHAQVVTPADVARFGRHGIVASMQPTHETSDRTMAEARLGPARLPTAYAWRSLKAAGATLAFGSDFPVEKPDPFAGWAAAITRQGADGEPAGGWQPQERVTREEALYAFTQGAAYAGFAEKMFGRLAPGQYADFIVLDRDPMTVTPADLRATKVEQTWIGGVRAWARK